MSVNSKLIPISYFSPKQSIRLNAYADTIIYEPDGRRQFLRAIRFGGYPEMVRALADALYAGADLEATIGAETYIFASEPKRYQRQFSHDGVYAEAVLLALDDELDSAQSEQEQSQQALQQPPRRSFLFCPADDSQRLFEELDRKTDVPMIPAFKDYVLRTLEQRSILKRLSVLSIRERLDAWVLLRAKDDANIISAVEDGLKDGQIQIPGAATAPNGFERVSSVTDYLNTFGSVIAARIRAQFTPLYDPAAEPLSKEVMDINRFIKSNAGYSLYNAQLAVVEAVTRKLKTGKSAFIVAECGSGKTKIGAAAMAALHALRTNQAHRKKVRTFNIVMCPAHVAPKWVREIHESLPNAEGVIVRSITELDQLYERYRKGNKSIYAILSKEKARDGYMRRPAVVYHNWSCAFVCPDCGHPIEVSVCDDGSDYLVHATQRLFRRETRKNHKCSHCGASLWTAVNPMQKSNWVKIGGYGWVYRYLAAEHLSLTKDTSVLEQLTAISQNPDGCYPTLGAYRRYPLSTYIKRRYKGKVDGLIVDELHEYNNDSGQGEAMGEIFSAAKKVIGMTATLINGYSSGIFHLLYRTVPHLMQADDKPYRDPERFNAEYGVVERVYEEPDAEYASNRRTRRRQIQTRQLPGVSPLVYSRFLLEQAAFLTLSDMGKELPDYEEIPVALQMPQPVENAYSKMEYMLVSAMKRDKRLSRKILSAYLNLLTVYPDQPYNQAAILHPETGEPIVTPEDLADFDWIGPKEAAVLELAEKALAKGERVLVYTSWVRTDSQQKLQQLLQRRGYRAEILTDKVKTTEREAWVQKRLAAELQVLITNPSLVETGLDLNAFTTLIFYSMGTKLFTLRQASRRSWRINQTAPKVTVYLLYYQHTMQHKFLKLMASKLAAAGMIEGNFSEEGLAAMSDIQDMTTQMAKELMLGIRDSVEDLAASFKKMAVLHTAKPEGPEPVQNAAPIRQPPAVISLPPATESPQFEFAAAPQKTRKKKEVTEDANQLSFFDFVA